jgi:hypothetical protein
MKAIDTHTIVKELTSVGASDALAEVLIARFVAKEELDVIEKEHLQLATKMDIIRLETKIESAGNRLESSIKGLDINIKWIMAILLAILSILIIPLIKTV